MDNFSDINCIDLYQPPFPEIFTDPGNLTLETNPHGDIVDNFFSSDFVLIDLKTFQEPTKTDLSFSAH